MLMVNEDCGFGEMVGHEIMVVFVEASPSICLEELRDDESIHTYENFFPLDQASFQEIASLEDAPLFAAQLTTFDKGGYTLAVMYCHAAVDGPCFSLFVSLWATRGEQISNAFDFSSPINILNLNPHTDRRNSETAAAGVTMQELPPTWMKQEVSPNSIVLAHQPRMKPGSSSLLFLKAKIDVVNTLKSQLAQELLGDQQTITSTTHAAENGNGNNNRAANLSSYVAISALVWRASIRARNLPEDEDTRFIAAINCRNRCNNIPSKYFGNAILDAVVETSVGELINNNISYAAKTIQNSLERLTTGDSLQSVSNMMEQEKQFAFSAKFRGERDVMVTDLMHDLLTSCDYGWGTPCCLKADRLRLGKSFLCWHPKAKPTDDWSFFFKSTPDATSRMLQDPEFMSFVTLNYATMYEEPSMIL